MWGKLIIVKSGECTSIHCTLLSSFLKYFHYKNKYTAFHPHLLSFSTPLHCYIFKTIIWNYLIYWYIVCLLPEELQAPHTQNVPEPYSLLYSQHQKQFKTMNFISIVHLLWLPKQVMCCSGSVFYFWYYLYIFSVLWLMYCYSVKSQFKTLMKTTEFSSINISFNIFTIFFFL